MCIYPMFEIKIFQVWFKGQTTKLDNRVATSDSVPTCVVIPETNLKKGNKKKTATLNIENNKQ